MLNVDFKEIYKGLDLKIKNKLKKIKLLVTDFDGVWTNNLVVHCQDGKEAIIRSKADSQGIDLLYKKDLYDKKNYESLNHPLDILILSQESNPLVKSVAEKIKVKCIYGKDEKLNVFYNEIKKRNLTSNQVLYLGNDLNDIDCMKHSGLSAAVVDSYFPLFKIADYVTKIPGGQGAIREIIELMIESKKDSDL